MNTESQPSAWEICKTEGEGGTGNWRALRRSIEEMEQAAAMWKQELGNVGKAWLCWNMNDDWCLLQQKLILETGWTPVVGWDPNTCPSGPKKMASGALAIDFNKMLKFPVMFPHVPMEFAFLWADKLAFWHADMLLRREGMVKATSLFDNLNEGEIAAVYSYGGLRTLFTLSHHRYWEVLGCTTKTASEDMYINGCGWWRNWATNHVNAPTDEKSVAYRNRHNWDHGGGVLFWKRHHEGKIRKINESFIKEGHFSVTSKKNYLRASSKSEEMELNFSLKDICKKFDIDNLLS